MKIFLLLFRSSVSSRISSASKPSRTDASLKSLTHKPVTQSFRSTKKSQSVQGFYPFFLLIFRSLIKCMLTGSNIEKCENLLILVAVDFDRTKIYEWICIDKAIEIFCCYLRY